MRTVLLAVATGAVASMLNVGAAHAQNYPFCVRNGGGPGDCKYNTYEQCLAAVSGTGGECQPNVWLSPREPAPVVGRRPRPNRTYGPQY
jgi:hypothetical protein